MEHFYTIQGEGYYQGAAAYFVRLGGCDVGCTWCDVKESWDAAAHPTMSVEAIVEAVVQAGAPLCVITGGEPLLHNLDALTTALQQKNIKTNIETSGTHPLSGNWNWICLSPKRFKPCLPQVCAQANELKIVVYHKNDFRFAEEYAAQVGPQCRLFLQPEWSQRDAMTPLIIDYVKQHPQWQISLQLHKYLNVP
ncbi:MAG: radical SAM protein [Bacteroidetes bacterium]|nr:radical SAM protein [Bacteroidota bacterium]